MPDDVYLWLMDHCNAYGMTLHFTLRKRLIEATAHETIRKGVTQIIVLGAGFDSLVLRLHRQYPNIIFFEMDQPATQAAKREALTENTASNLVFLPCDLSMRGALRHHLIHHSSFSVNRKTLFILEGLCMYFTESENKELFNEIQALCPAGSQIIFGALDVSKTQAGGIARLVLKLREESYRWVINAGEMPVCIAKNNFTLIKTFPYRGLQRTYRTKNEMGKLTGKSFENYYLVERHSARPPGSRAPDPVKNTR
jgi:methyltransferase (TIGR00027 family)